MSTTDRRNLRRLRRCSEQVNRMLADGSFHSLAPGRRGKLLRRLRDLYEALLGIVPEITIRHILAGAAVLVIGVAGCGGGGGIEADTTTETDVADVSDLDVPHDMDAVDSPDAFDVPDAPDVPDAVDSFDAPDTHDATDTIDATDTRDTIDAHDVLDTFDVRDTIDVADSTDPGMDMATPDIFASPVTNPFGIVLPYVRQAVPALTDIDGDGDIDLFLGANGYYGSALYYYRNTGTASAPAFASPVTDPFGLRVSYSPACAFADLDGDGDPDMLTGRYEYFTWTFSLIYEQNTGSPTSPAFAPEVANPFGLTSPTGYVWSAVPTFADLDKDGDQDLFLATSYGDIVFYQNTGSATAPAFAAPLSNPYGITRTSSYGAAPALADLDEEGDLDLFVGEYDYFTWSGAIRYWQNTGSTSAPAFSNAGTDPFGITGLGYWNPYPAFADMDADADLDLFVGGGYSGLLYFENTTH